MIASSALLFILLMLFVGGLVIDHHTGWLTSTLTDDAPHRRRPDDKHVSQK